MTQQSWGDDEAAPRAAWSEAAVTSWGDDEALLAELREALTGAAPVPADFTAAARASLAWRTIDSELLLAELTFDSACDELVATRSGGDTLTRLLVFDGAGYRVELELGPDGIVGQVTPADGGVVSCQTPTGIFDEGGVDELGCFVLRCPASGAVRLHVQLDRHPVATGWFTLR